MIILQNFDSQNFAHHALKLGELVFFKSAKLTGSTLYGSITEKLDQQTCVDRVHSSMIIKILN